MESIRDLLPEYNSGGMDIREAGIRCRDNGQRTPVYRREQDVRIEAEAGGRARLCNKDEHDTG